MQLVEDKPIAQEEAAPEEVPPVDETYNAKITAVGDLMVHEWQFDDAFDKATNTFDFNKSFDKIRPYLENSDFTIGNLETTFAGEARPYSFFPAFNTPDAFAAALANAGFDWVSTANNHCNDARADGISRTIDILDAAGIAHAGTYKTKEERDTIFIKEINNIKFAFISYTYGTNGIPTDTDYRVNLIDKEKILADIGAAKENSDCIIMFMHMGTEYADLPNAQQLELTREMIGAGAGVVLISHPHVLQKAEYVTADNGNVGFAAYSLGNFISCQRTLPRDEGVIFNLYFQKSGEETTLTAVDYIPTWVQFINGKGVYDIQVLPVQDTLAAYDNGADVNLRPKDITRLRAVAKDIPNRISLEE